MPISSCGVPVPGPQFIPAKYGLLSAATVSTPADSHWEGVGVTWDDDLCVTGHSTTLLCPDGETDPKDADREFEFCCAEPFIVYGSYNCPPVGRPANAAFDVATRRLRATEERELERVFWTGLVGDGAVINPSLSEGNSSCGSAPVDLTGEEPGDGLSPVSAIAVLESALAACSPGGGVIHANYGVAAYLAENMLIIRDGDALFTPTGQRLAFGAGYPGTGPDNEAAAEGQTWLFATGPVAVWRSDIFLTPPRLDEAVDRNLNNVQVFAERVYAAGWSCCLFAVRMALTG